MTIKMERKEYLSQHEDKVNLIKPSFCLIEEIIHTRGSCMQQMTED